MFKFALSVSAYQISFTYYIIGYTYLNLLIKNAVGTSILRKNFFFKYVVFIIVNDLTLKYNQVFLNIYITYYIAILFILRLLSKRFYVVSYNLDKYIQTSAWRLLNDSIRFQINKDVNPQCLSSVRSNTKKKITHQSRLPINQQLIQ